MTVWMDFNPLKYRGKKRSIPVGNNIAFDFCWDEHFFGVIFDVVMRIEGSRFVFVLYEQFNRAECLPFEDDA